jgi:hypothetical protein
VEGSALSEMKEETSKIHPSEKKKMVVHLDLIRELLGMSGLKEGAA